MTQKDAMQYFAQNNADCYEIIKQKEKQIAFEKKVLLGGLVAEYLNEGGNNRIVVKDKCYGCLFLGTEYAQECGVAEIIVEGNAKLKLKIYSDNNAEISGVEYPLDDFSGSIYDTMIEFFIDWFKHYAKEL